MDGVGHSDRALLGSPESTFDYDIKRFQSNSPMEYLEHTEAGELSDAF